jgi:glycerol kinase
MLTTVAWDLGDGAPVYALEGAIFVTGAAVQWLRDGLGIIRSASDIGELAATVPDSGGVYVVPAFTGLGAHGGTHMHEEQLLASHVEQQRHTSLAQ